MVEKIALGMLGISAEDLDKMTLRQFFNAYDGFRELEQSRSLERWKVARWQVFLLLNVQLDKKNKLKSLSDLFELPDEQKPAKKLTKEEFERIQKKMDLDHLLKQ